MKEKGYQRLQETFGGDKNVFHFGCADGFMSVYVCQNLSNFILDTHAIYWASVTY